MKGAGVESRLELGLPTFPLDPRARTRQTVAMYVAYPFVVIGLWWGIKHVFAIQDFLVPSPGAVFYSLSRLPSYYFQHTLVTAEEALLGLLLGFALGAVCGLAIAYVQLLERLASPIIAASQVFPKEALAPLFLVYFGFGILSKVVISALICFFPIVVSTVAGLRSVPPVYRKLMYVVGASSGERFLRCDLPFAVPYLMAGLKVAATLSLIGAVVGEFVGSTAGLGFVIRSANADIGTERVFAAILLLGLIGGCLLGGCLIIEHTILKRYMHSR